MTGEPEEEHDIARPFISAFTPTPAHRVASNASRHGAAGAEGDHDSSNDEMVRPYFVTGGRVHDAVTGLETVFVRTDKGLQHLARYSFERHGVLRLCETPQSLAEISALLRMPLGVAAVVAHDLESEGMLAKTRTMTDPASDPTIIMRLIDVVRAL